MICLSPCSTRYPNFLPLLCAVATALFNGGLRREITLKNFAAHIPRVPTSLLWCSTQDSLLPAHPCCSISDTMGKCSSPNANPGNPSNIRLESVHPLWLDASPTEHYLLLEDSETGDILMPLIYMKHVFGANYSRKLASLKHRLVTIPVNVALTKHAGLVYWQWAFESPHAVKTTVRKEIGEATSQGHLRLVLVPIVYNALATHADARNSALFRALHRVIRVSTYWPLLRPVPEEVLMEMDTAVLPMPLFQGPRLLERTA